MKPIISPWLIYFASRADNLTTFFGVIAGICSIIAMGAFFAGLAGYDEPFKFRKTISKSIIGYMVVVTRDMFGIAMKATYGIVNGEPIMIYKDPKTDTSHLKKSHKGCCCIYYDDNGELQCEDGYNDVFRDGALSTVYDKNNRVHCNECPLSKGNPTQYDFRCKANSHYNRHTRAWEYDD